MKYYHLIGASLGLAIIQWALQGPLETVRWLSYLFLSIQGLLLGSYVVLMCGYFILMRPTKTIEEEPVVESTTNTSHRQAAHYTRSTQSQKAA
ncbi:hypothetical protein [Enterococcus bulliens]